MQITLAQARRLYEDEFKTEMPSRMPYQRAGEMVLNRIGKNEFITRVARLDLDGNHLAQFTVYHDREDAGDSYTVYDNDLRDYVGQFLADDPDLKTYLANGILVDGLDNRQKGD